MKLAENIFRVYDIRGLYPSELNEETAELIGKAFATFLSRLYDIPNPRILVGRDNRSHGEGLRERLVSGLVSAGAQVDIVKDSPSPMLYFGVCDGNYDGGINVTASHNEAEYNGCKLLGRQAHSIAGDDIQTIKNMILDQDFSTGEGSHQEVDIFEVYTKKLTELVTLDRPLKVVVDAGNGIAGKYYPRVLKKMGCEVIELYCEQDGTFPNHEPDPVVEENTADLKQRVIREGADLGLSFDGDGDRFAVVDEKGNYHDANESFTLLIRDVLSRHPKASVVYTVSNSTIIPQEVEKLGGTAHMVPVGHSYVEHAMSDHQAILGGEQSGHFFVSEDYYGYDDALYAAVKLLSVYAASEDSVSAHYDSIPRVERLPEMRPSCADDRKFEVIAEISKRLSNQYPVETMDGIRVDFEDGSWFGIRASNTSPVLSVIIEALETGRLTEIHEELSTLLKDYDISI